MNETEHIQNAVNFMEQNLAGHLNYSDIAKKACMSEFHFQRIFSILCGVTLGEYIRNRRLSLAARELVSTQKSITDLALEYGYDTPEGFARAFHRYYGITPSAARSRNVLLPFYEKLSVQQKLFGGMAEMDDMTRYGKRGYYVKENAPVYFTKDLERTCKWFTDVLGWYGDICGRNKDGTPIYGCVFDSPGELIVSNLTPFRGIHIFLGEPAKGVAGFINVQGIEAFHKLVTDNGWNEISQITEQPWGARECCVTTVDGAILRFFETVTY